MQTFHIHITGIVQGVGFRPFIYRLARQAGMKGWVSNTVHGVHIEVNASREETVQFVERIKSEAPPISQIVEIRLSEVSGQTFSEFSIKESTEEADPTLMITPDFALCDHCRQELKDPADRRHGYPFITCTYCGPRYSIITKVPYDRPNTVMDPFVMCKSCKDEYDDPLDRRYYSQTNSCEKCGIHLTLSDVNGKKVARGAEALEHTSGALTKGQIIAVKGIGGYLLMCDATNPEVVQRLRQRKHRPAKPFAVMYPDIAAIEKDAILTNLVRDWLQSAVSPIVLVRSLDSPATGLTLEDIAPGLHQIGVMIPYTPLFELIASRVDRPLVATSGNITESPIVFRDTLATRDLAGIADLILSHNRDIVVPQDDSVLRFSPLEGQKIVLRRSRGIAPGYFHKFRNLPGQNILAMGASMKASFTYLTNGSIYISQYLGDLESLDTQEAYRDTLEHFLGLFDNHPDLILVDGHPDYFSTRLGIELSNKWEVPVNRVQHHKAHLAACVADSGLIDSKEGVLGVIWDGTGYGEDQQIWGGEFFGWEDGRIERISHLPYFPVIAGDKMAREPRISAFALISGLGMDTGMLRPKFSETEWKIYRKMAAHPRVIHTSSIGRVFDAVASLLGIMDRATYEGEAAMLLEEAAIRHPDLSTPGYLSGVSESQNLLETVITGIINDINHHQTPESIAFRFHKSLSEMIKLMSDTAGYPQIAFSGGVFQNGLLVDLIIRELSDGYRLHFHEDLSPNDENISFGQLMYYIRAHK